MSDQVSKVTPEQQIADLQNELKDAKVQLQQLRAAAWGAADIFRREAEEDCGNGQFIATPIMVEMLWRELNGVPEDRDLLRWARDNELADLREQNERLKKFVGKVRGHLHIHGPNKSLYQYIKGSVAELDTPTNPAPAGEPTGGAE